MRLKPKSRENPYPNKTGQIVPDEYCSHLKQPALKKVKDVCRKSCFRWEVSKWNECSSGCGSGTETRKVTCTNGKQISTKDCDPSKKPSNYRPCESTNHCFWKTAKWKNVSANPHQNLSDP